MITVEKSVQIDRPVEIVFAFVSDPTNIPKWRSDVIEMRNASPPVHAGSTFDELIKFMGQKVWGMQVLEIEPNKKEVIKAISGPGVRPTQTFVFAPSGSGTRLDFRVEVQTYGLFRLMEPLLPGMIGKNWDGYLATLKRIIEG
jgi:uncharacterized protein YndB with AHSA1/START domain